MLCLRPTKNFNELETVSYDNVNRKRLKGVCAYDVTDAVADMIQNDEATEQEAYARIARKQAEFDNFHCSNAQNSFVIFEGDFIEYDRDNQDFEHKRAIVAKINYYIAHSAQGALEQCQYGYISDPQKVVLN